MVDTEVEGECSIRAIARKRDEAREMQMKRVALFLVLGAIAAVAVRTSAMIPEQIKIEKGLIAGTTGHRPAVRTGVQGHSVCRAASR